IYFEAVSDTMTKLYNHNYIIKRLQDEMYLAKKFSTKLSLIMLDIDHFKQINDKYGHHFGDVVIITIAEIIRNNIRITDIAGRYGGEEFCIILPHTSVKEAVNVAQRIKDNIVNKKFFISSQYILLTSSFGVKEFNSENTPEEYITAVDKLLYNAKLSGRNRICF
ncbi:MAG: GGDEF domain-containing protein, partial [Endomicrobia bacterium]|nr:GGDEF domain-containing protein [Endomicrobiia bacterium]